MKIKEKALKAVPVMLCMAMAFGNFMPANAEEVYASGNVVYAENADDYEERNAAETRYEDIEVTYNQASSYQVTIPKTIVLGTDKQSSYSVKVEGDIAANKQVCVVPVDGIEGTEVFDFYMKDQTAGSTKADVVAEVNQAKFYWNYEEVSVGYEEDDNYITADGLSAGNWKGTFQMEISLRTDPTHIHNYVGEITKEPTCTEPGEKTYTCDCGDSYTETIPAKGHDYVGGICIGCGREDPDHKHSYTESTTKEPTCTEAGEKTYTCNCGDSYTEVIPAKGHHFEDGECTDCGEKDENYHKHSYTGKITKEPTCTEAGEKTFTCTCGDSYTESIPAKGHYYGDDDKCTGCGELNPNHVHSYTEIITKEPTCTEAGEKTYTCNCGGSYTEEIPAKGHDYVDGVCTGCGDINDPYAVAPANEYLDWYYTLNNSDNTITLIYYKGKSTDVIVYSSYELNGKVYQTKIGNPMIISGSIHYMFYNSSVKTVTFSDYIDYSDTTSMKFMFNSCTSLVSVDFGKGFDTSSVADMSYMFANCNKLTNLDVSTFDTSKVTDMSQMFYKCSSLIELDVSNFDTSNVTAMSWMFRMCESLKSIDLSSFNFNKTVNTNGMFESCELLTYIKLSDTNTGDVTSADRNMYQMFYRCYALTDIENLNNLNTENVVNMESMFSGCSSLTNLDLSSFNTSKVTNMVSMFGACSLLANLDVSSFETSNVTNMKSMFQNCLSLTNLDLGSFNTSKVINMSYMFSGCSKLKTICVDESLWKVPKTANYMFQGCSSSYTYK